MSRKHFALFLPSMRGGGAEQVMKTLAEGIARQGHRVDLVLAKAEGPFLRHLPDSVHVVDLKANRVIKSLPALVKYLRSERPEAMLSAIAHANIVAIVARDMARVSTRIVVSEHSTLSVSAANALSKRARTMPWLMRYTYPRADAIVAVSNGVADDLARAIGLPRERIATIYNPVVTADFLARSREPLDHPWFLPDEPPVLLAVGRLVEAKNFAMLITAFARVREQRPVRLLILGEGEKREELERLIGQTGFTSDIAMPGFVENPYAYMRGATAFVLSSRWEGLPTVLIEAMACGCPIVSTDCPSGPAEILENGEYGKLVSVGDVAALAVAMIATLDDPLGADVARRARDFGVEQAVASYLSALRRNGGLQQ